MHTATLTVKAIKRMQNSVNGNPRYRLTLDHNLQALTKKDTGDAYVIGDWMLNQQITFGIDSQGRIVRVFTKPEEVFARSDTPWLDRDV